MPRLLNESAEIRGPKEFALFKPLTKIGRRSFNDVVIPMRSVSAEHALIRREGSCYFIEDLGSTNGTFVNGQFVRRHLLNHGDRVELGGCALRFRTDDAPHQAVPADALSTQQQQLVDAMHGHEAWPPSGVTLPHTLSMPLPPVPERQAAHIQMLSGETAGRELPLTKVVTTIGKPGVQLASVARSPTGFILTHLQGPVHPSVNGEPMAQDSQMVHSGDVIDLAGTQMRLVAD